MVAVGASHIEGRGLFADRPHEPGELVHRLGGRRATTLGVAARIAMRRIRWDDPLQIGRVTYLVLDPVSLAANHSCDPNLGLRGQGDLVALRTIAAGDELTYDYSMTVPRSIFTLGWRLACACSAARCRGDVGNLDTVPVDTLRRYLAAGAVPAHTLRRVRELVTAAEVSA